MLVSRLTYSSTQKIVATCSTERSGVFQLATMHYSPEDRILNWMNFGKIASYLFSTVTEVVYN
jgi:hypothetical protein